MGSVIDECECPNCKYPHAISDFYYNVGIEYIFCRRCGFNNDWIQPEKGTEEDEMIETEHGKFGCLTLLIDGSGSLYGLDYQHSAEELIKDFNVEEYKNQEGRICTDATITFLRDGVWKVMDLLTSEIRDFDEWEKDERKEDVKELKP